MQNMVKKGGNKKQRSKTSKSNIRPKVPGGGWTSGMNTNAVSKSTEVDIDELLLSTDDSGVKEIIDEFRRLHEDDPLTSRMKQIIKFVSFEIIIIKRHHVLQSRVFTINFFCKNKTTTRV